MDNAELIKIAITAVIATVFRELFTFAIKHSVKLAIKLKRIAINILKENTHILMIIVDLLVLALTGYSLSKYIFGHMPVTSSEVVSICFTCILWFYWPQKLRQDVDNYQAANKQKNVQPVAEIEAENT